MQIIKNNNDFYTNVERALDEIDVNWRDYAGYVIVGSHLPTDIDQKLEIIKTCREEKIPLLGICLGMQLMVVEFAQSFLGLNATSQEIKPDGSDCVVIKMPKLRVGIFPVKERQESHWHNYKINEGYADFTYGKVLEEIKLKNHPYFTGVQYHPEYQSTLQNHHPVLVEFIEVCKKAPKTLGASPPILEKRKAGLL